MSKIETKRLLLRPLELADASIVQLLAGDRAIADTTLNIPHPYEDGMAEDWIASIQAKSEAGEIANFAITLRQNPQLVGCIGLRIDRLFNRAALGYWVGVPFWNQGYCTEAAVAVIDHGFRDLGLNRIHSSHLRRNPASGRVMEKAGMTREGEARQHTKKWGRYEDLVSYGILHDDWLACRRGQSREEA